jgi:acetyl-CoA synthetase
MRTATSGSSAAPTTSSSRLGHLIGPFEVESALMEHAAVAEAGVIGKPDPVAGEVVKAFVTLKPGTRRVTSCDASYSALPGKRLGAAVAPKEIEFVPSCRRRGRARSCAGC